MALKVLGQLACAATTAETVGAAVPAGKTWVVSTIAVCNRSTTAVTYRLAIRVNGASLTNSQYIAYDCALPGNSSDFLTLGISLSAGDIITAYASSANVSVNVFGDEA